MPAPTVTVDHVRDPVDRSDGSALLPCPEKGGQQIAAGRCVATTDCPRAGSCPFRAEAVRVVEEARALGLSDRGSVGLMPCDAGCGRRTRQAMCEFCRGKQPRPCSWCDRSFTPARKAKTAALVRCCSAACAARWRQYQKDRKSGGSAPGRLAPGILTQPRRSGRMPVVDYRRRTP